MGNTVGGPSFTPSSRLLVVAPHPDDESLGCGVLLQQAVAAGAAIKVVYLTDGENNPWPQRCLSRRWRLNASDRQRWAKMRRMEAIAALKVLGVSAVDARFLGWPDQGLCERLRAQSDLTLAQLRYLISAFGPTDIIAPDNADRHGDHKAAGAMLERLFSTDDPTFSGVRCWTYIIHGRPRAFFRAAEVLPETSSEVRAKEHAIGCHETQLLLSRRRFLRYARRPESFRLHNRGASF